MGVHTVLPDVQDRRPASGHSDLPLFHRLEDAVRRRSVGHRTVKRLVANGLLPGVQTGSARRVTSAVLEHFVLDLADGKVSVAPRTSGRHPSGSTGGPARGDGRTGAGPSRISARMDAGTAG